MFSIPNFYPITERDFFAKIVGELAEKTCWDLATVDARRVSVARVMGSSSHGSLSSRLAEV